jgi:GT2 family glycosyltransferase
LVPLLEARSHGQTLAALAHGLLSSAEGRALHGDPREPADRSFVERAITAAAAGQASAAAFALTSALIGLDRAEALATLAETPLFRDDPPSLPTLFADRRPDDPAAYAFWRRTYEPKGPLPPATSTTTITIAMQVGDTTAEAACHTAGSLLLQSYATWRLVIVGTLRSPWSRQAISQLSGDDRIELLRPGPDSTPAAELNRALRDAPTGAAFVVVPGDMLAPDALHYIATAFNDPAVDLVYTDEDRLDPAEGRCAPRFKTGLSLDAMLAGNAIGQLAAYRTALFASLGGLDCATSPYWAYDLALRVCQHNPAGVRHLPYVLLHTAGPPTDWPVPASHRRAAPGLDVAAAPWPRLVPACAAGVLVSVIVLTRDHAELLQAVADGVLRRTSHTPLELILVDHSSTDPAAISLLERLARDNRVRMLPFAGAFNFAAMNNQAAALAQGEILLLLNNDIEIVRPDWLDEMAGHAWRPEVGLVGARLLYRDGSLQHGGVVLGPGGRATHVFRGAAPTDPGYLGLLAITRDVSAVTGACIAIRREVYRAVGGMNEGLPVTWSDIDLCQRVRNAGLRIIWTPHAVLTHLEGETRGRDAADPDKQAAFEADGARYRAIWGAAVEFDPYLNPNLAATDYQLCLAPPRLPPRHAS